jgi:hypothetical protein
MEKEYILGLGFAYSIWSRPDLRPKPENTRRIADVLQEAGIEVYKVRGWLASVRTASSWSMGSIDGYTGFA